MSLIIIILIVVFLWMSCCLMLWDFRRKLSFEDELKRKVVTPFVSRLLCYFCFFFLFFVCWFVCALVMMMMFERVSRCKEGRFYLKVLMMLDWM